MQLIRASQFLKMVDLVMLHKTRKMIFTLLSPILEPQRVNISQELSSRLLNHLQTMSSHPLIQKKKKKNLKLKTKDSFKSSPSPFWSIIKPNFWSPKRLPGSFKIYVLLRVGFEPTPFRTRTLIWRLRPTRPSQPLLSRYL